MVSSAFYDVGTLKQVAVNLFYGWGYNFYRQENQLRADDLMVRAKVSALLSAARGSIDTAESAYRREFLPPPSRAKPYPDASAVSNAQLLERLSKAIGALEGQIRAQPAPESDRMTQRHRNEAAILIQLVTCDETLAGQAELLRTLLDGKTANWIIESQDLINEGFKAIGETLFERQRVLMI